MEAARAKFILLFIGVLLLGVSLNAFTY
jgi:hypothetical protein